MITTDKEIEGRELADNLEDEEIGKDLSRSCFFFLDVVLTQAGTDADEWAEEIELEEVEDEEAALDARGKHIPSGKCSLAFSKS